MIRWIAPCVVAMLATLSGCGGDSRDGKVKSMINQITQVQGSIQVVKESLEKFAAKKEAKDDEAARKELEGAVEAAKKLKETAEKLQELNRDAARMAPPTADEKKALLNSNKGISTAIADVETAHAEMKKVLADVTTKYGEDAIRPFLRAMDEANAAFVALIRRQ